MHSTATGRIWIKTRRIDPLAFFLFRTKQIITRIIWQMVMV